MPSGSGRCLPDVRGWRQKSGVSILDAMSLSYVEKGERATCSILQKKTFQHRLKELWERHNALLSERCLSRHAAFELPWFMALLYRARRKGVLANSQFLWLRPLDRPLWYALCQCGGRTAMMEGGCRMGALPCGRTGRTGSFRAACGRCRAQSQGGAQCPGLADGDFHSSHVRRP